MPVAVVRRRFYHPGMTGTLPDNAEKQRVWQAYFDREPARVPMRVTCNPRMILLDPDRNEDGYTAEQCDQDPEIHVRVALLFQRFVHFELNQYTDSPTGAPERWQIGLIGNNIYEAMAFGAVIQYHPGQVPDAEPIFTDENKHELFKVDIDHPLETGYFRDVLAFWQQMQRVCEGMRFEGRPVELMPWCPAGTDGPVTVACGLRGTDFLMDLAGDPAYARKLLEFVTRAAIVRRHAMWDYWGEAVEHGNWMADDSCAMLGVEMYERLVLPMHRMLYESGNQQAARCMHMCGDATRLFPTIRRELNVTIFDTGFPVDHGKLREQLGEDVEISGGPEVALLLGGTTDEVYQRTCDILRSGIMRGGRYILQEGNNLPPRTPMANIEAMYRACLDHGRY